MPNKKVTRTLFGFSAVIILLLAVIISLRFRSVQTALVNRYLDKLEEKYDGKLSVGEVLIRWPHRIEIRDLLILDPIDDTLLYASSLRTSVARLHLDDNKLNLNRVIIEDPVVNLIELPQGGMNYQLLIDSFKISDTVSGAKKFSLNCSQLVLRRGRVSLHKYGAINQQGKVSWDNLSVSRLESQINRIEVDSTGVRADIHLLSFVEQSGFNIVTSSGRVSVDSTGISTSGVEIVTGNSLVVSPSARLVFGSKSDADSTDAGIELVLGMETYISPKDINLIGGIDNSLDDPIEISGLIKGTLKKAELQDTRLSWSSLAYFEGDLSYEYPGQLKEAFFDLRTRNLMLNITLLTDQVFSGQVPGFELDVPEAVRNLGSIEYSGLFTGTLENFITTGQWALPYGMFTTNLKVQKNQPVKGYNFTGKISAGSFNPDQWIDQAKNITALDFQLDVDGVWDGDKYLKAYVNGNVSHFTLNNYTFQDLAIKGQADGKMFDGTLILRDPNIHLDLAGTFNFGTSKPELNFDLVLAKTDLAALNVIRNDTAAAVSMTMHGDLAGKGLDDVTGTIRVTNTVYSNSRGTLAVDDLTLTANPEAGRRQIVLSSDYVDARLVGNIHMDDLKSQMQSLVARFIPALTNITKTDPSHLNDFAFNVHLKNPSPVTEVLLPALKFKDNTRVSGSYDASEQIIYLEGASPQFAIGGTQYTGLDVRLQSRGDSVIFTGDLDKVQFDRNNVFEKVNLDVVLSENNMQASLFWKNSTLPRNEGNIECTGLVRQNDQGKLSARFGFPASELYYNDSLWNLAGFTLDLDPGRIAVNGMKLSHKEESLGVRGAISTEPSDTLYVVFNDLNLNHVNQMNRSKKTTLSGYLTGDAKFFDMKNKGMFLADLVVDSLGFNGQMLGKTTISSRSGGTGQPVDMSVLAMRGAIKTLQINGRYDPVNDSLDFAIDVDKLRMDIANPFVRPDLRDVKGIATGHVAVTGKRSNPQLNGEVLVQKGSFVVDYINTKFQFTHKVLITPGAFVLNQMDLQDDEGNHAMVNGAVLHDNFTKIRLDLTVDCTDFVLFNADESNNDGYWGRAYATGYGTIKGRLRNLFIDVTGITSPKTKFFAPVNQEDEARDFEFITYVERPKEEVEPDLLDFTSERKKGYEVNLHGATVNIDIAVTPDAEVNIIFDEKVGDVLRAQGSGNIRISVNPASRWGIQGDYTIERGDYQFTLQNMPVKKLQLEPGGTIKWTKDIPTAQLDVDAVYRTKASLYDLIQDESNPDLTQRIPVEAHLLMSGMLQSPAFNFNIVIPPTSDDVARSQLANLTAEEMNKQVISLLVLNRFVPLQGSSSGTTRGYATAGLATTTEMLSNQLNYWLSQISNDFDIGFNYRPGDQLTSDEVEVALSKQFLNNRVTLNVNGNYDVRQTSTNANQLVGDVEVEYKINPNGKLRVKAFTRANDHLLYEYAPYTQGVGLFYREEFDSFGDLFKRYKSKLSGKDR